MNFYDIVSETCQFDEQFAKRLGFKRIFTLNKDIRAVGHGNENDKDLSRSIAFGKDANQLLALVKHGAPAVAITDSYIDRKLMEAIKDNGCVLVLPISVMTASWGVERSRNIYRMAKLYRYAVKKEIKTTFASMAKSPQYMNSYMQLIELAKLLGADDKYARHSLSETTKTIAD